MFHELSAVTVISPILIWSLRSQLLGVVFIDTIGFVPTRVIAETKCDREGLISFLTTPPTL